MTGWELGYASALLAGVISFLSPCVLPLVPGYLSFIAGRVPDTEDARRAGPGAGRLVAPIAFVLGFAVVFVLMGAGAGLIGQLLLQYRYEANLIGGGIVVAFGVFMTGLVRPRWLLRDYRALAWPRRGGTPAAAGVLGVAFGVGWTPCIGPVLGAILTVAATRSAEFDGVALLATYAAGLGIPFLVAAVFTDRFARAAGGLRHWGRWLHIGAGAIMIIVGLAMMTGQLTVFAYWLLEVFPALGRIG